MTNLIHLALQAPLPKPTPDSHTIVNVTRVIFAIFGAVALLVIVLAALRYTISQGESNAVSRAKNTIIYAFVGLMISIMATVILTFVLRNV